MERFDAQIYDGNRLVTTAIVRLHRIAEGDRVFLIGFIDPDTPGVLAAGDYRMVAEDGRAGDITDVSATLENAVRFAVCGPFENSKSEPWHAQDIHFVRRNFRRVLDGVRRRKSDGT